MFSQVFPSLWPSPDPDFFIETPTRAVNVRAARAEPPPNAPWAKWDLRGVV